jgi:hypothetical protein
VRPTCVAAGASYEIVRADRFSDAGGKEALLKYHSYLETANALFDYARPLPAVCFFYLDKDVEDLFKSLATSPHILYTPFYCVENALFIYGDIPLAAGAAGGIDTELVRGRIPDALAWRRKHAEQWKDFIPFCLLSQKYDLTCDCTFGRNTSPLNDPLDQRAAPQQVAQRKAELQQRYGCSMNVIERRFAVAKRLVERILRSNGHDLIFNGKWYRQLLIREVELAAAGEQYSQHALANGISAALASTIDFKAVWADYFRNPLAVLLQAI